MKEYYYLGGGVYAKLFPTGIDIMPNHHLNTQAKIWLDIDTIHALIELYHEMVNGEPIGVVEITPPLPTVTADAMQVVDSNGEVIGRLAFDPLTDGVDVTALKNDYIDAVAKSFALPPLESDVVLEWDEVAGDQEGGRR
jgi:hypothetical protein